MLNKEDLLKLKKEIISHDEIILLCHLVPDHDSVGSTNAMRKMIKKYYPEKEVKIYSQNSSFFDHFSPSIKYDNYKLSDDSLVIALDCANIERLSCEIDISAYNSIKIDHHPPRDQFAKLNIVSETHSSTCELLFYIFEELDFEIDKDIATLLYLGIIGDTGRFLYKNTLPSTYKCVSELVRTGMNPLKDVYPYVYKINIKDMKNKGILTKQFLMLNSFGLLLLTKKIMNDLSISPLDVSKFTNQFGTISELGIWIIIVEEDGYFKCSIRSKEVVINQIAAQFGGGGHPFASGAKVDTIEEAIELIKKLYEAANDTKVSENCACFEYMAQRLRSEKFS